MMIRHAFLLALAVALVPSATTAQQSSGGTVEAVVHDSLAGGPLRGATVQIVSVTDKSFLRTGDTDAQGTAVFRDLAPGRYRVGFMHPLLDELGVTAPDREVNVEAAREHRVRLSVPSGATLRMTVCGAKAGGDSAAAIVGTVRDPRDRMPLAEAAVSAQWIELVLGAGGINRRTPTITARTGANGWFALCGVPSGIVTLFARHASDSTPLIDLQLAPQEFRRRDIFVTAPGRGELRGRIVSSDSARPLARARVAVAGGPQGESSATGEWSLAGVPLGTQMVDVRAVGYYPERRAVDVVANAEPLVVELNSFGAVLDAVRITATRTAAADLGGFENRQRRGGAGRYLTAEQLANRNLLETSDLLRTLPGFLKDGSLNMRSNFSNGAGEFDATCPAEVYVDGHLMRGITASELDAIVKPEHILGIEVYSAGAPKPPQFDSGMSGCGSLVIWQKPYAERRRRR